MAGGASKASEATSYFERLTRCEIPRGADWNTRYRSALLRQNLSLADAPRRPYDVQAPRSRMGEGNGWPRETYIVELR
jgi:hypothetical protein